MLVNARLCRSPRPDQINQGFATNSNAARRERLAPHVAGRMCQGFFSILNPIIFFRPACHVIAESEAVG